MKIIQEYDKCIGCASCTIVCPKFWKMNEEGKADLLGGKKDAKTGNFELDLKNPSQDDVKCNKEAESVCPVQIIHIQN